MERFDKMEELLCYNQVLFEIMCGSASGLPTEKMIDFVAIKLSLWSIFNCQHPTT
jgi:hypothetical protein